MKWPASPDVIGKLAEESVKPCSAPECLEVTGGGRHHVIRIERVEMTWPESQWTFHLDGVPDPGAWVVDCDEQNRCRVTSYPRRISELPAAMPNKGLDLTPVVSGWRHVFPRQDECSQEVTTSEGVSWT
jgi:hypothetical protein